MSKCQHCKTPNPENYFNCRSCGRRASEPKFTTNSFVREGAWATAIRKDQVDFSSKDMNVHIKETQEKNAKEREKKMNSLIKWK